MILKGEERKRGRDRDVGGGGVRRGGVRKENKWKFYLFLF